jgi:transcriptional regulator with XRE-family HTH domain
MKSSRKRPELVDIHVGSRVRSRRAQAGMSQEKLGDHLGITFQQIQKYEKGVNRVSASRLQQIARVLTVPVSYFFEDAPCRRPRQRGRPMRSQQATSSPLCRATRDIGSTGRSLASGTSGSGAESSIWFAP